MRALLHPLVRALEQGQSAQLVTVLAASGSTPRGAGALLAVLADGSSAGTVGGGNVEFEAIRLAGDLLRTGENALRSFRFLPGDAANLGMVCGGDVTLHFQCLTPADAPLFRTLLEATGASAGLWLVRRLDGAAVTAMALAGRTGPRNPDFPPELLQDRAVLRDGWSAVPVVRAGRVYIFGGGHVSQALVPALAAAGFRPVVYDDRPEFAAPERFPQAAEVLCGGFDQVSAQVAVTADDYVVIMTRGHQADYEVLTQLLRSGARYIGCIGSRRKLALCRDRLLESGFTEAEYARLRAPIGLNIGAETPAEIAVSITAQLIAARAGLDLRYQ